MASANKGSSKPITVMAIRKGYYQGIIRQPGQKFVVDNAQALGTWMSVDGVPHVRKGSVLAKKEKPLEAPMEDLETLCKHCHRYMTFIQNGVESILGINSEESKILSISKNGVDLIIEYHNLVAVFDIEGENCELIVSFKKTSRTIKTLYELSIKPT